MKPVAYVAFIAGLIAGGVAAVLIGLQSPDSPDRPALEELVDTASFDSVIDAALADYEANDARTEGAPQQQVVNGWIARDLLMIIAEQNEASANTLDSLVALQATSPADERPARLLVVLTLVVCWIAAWASVAWWHQLKAVGPTAPQPGPAIGLEREQRSLPSEDHPPDSE